MRLEGEFGPVADGCVLGPPDQAPDLFGDGGGIGGVGLGTGGQRVVGIRGICRPGGERQLASSAADLGYPLAAHIVAATLEYGEGEAVVGGGGHQGEVLVGQLVLQRLGGGGHDDLFARERSRHEVGERLAGSGTRLDDEIAAAGHGGGDRDGHLDLSGAGLAAPGQPGRDTAQCGGHLVGHPPTLPVGPAYTGGSWCPTLVSSGDPLSRSVAQSFSRFRSSR